jgi:hypothetical protein
MTTRRVFLLLAAALLLCGNSVPAEKDDLQSGPQAGENLPGPFLSLVAYSDDLGLMGKKTDFSEQYGGNPVVLVFAREISNPLTDLVKKLDAEVTKSKPAKLRAVVVFLSDDDALETNLKDFGEKQGIKNVNLAIMEPAGPKHYKLSKEADVTVLLYKRRKVEANHAFKKDKLNEKGVEKILADEGWMEFVRQGRRHPRWLAGAGLA